MAETGWYSHFLFPNVHCAVRDRVIPENSSRTTCMRGRNTLQEDNLFTLQRAEHVRFWPFLKEDHLSTKDEMASSTVQELMAMTIPRHCHHIFSPPPPPKTIMEIPYSGLAISTNLLIG
jgi:hypothetical protein